MVLETRLLGQENGILLCVFLSSLFCWNRYNYSVVDSGETVAIAVLVVVAAAAAAVVV